MEEQDTIEFGKIKEIFVIYKYRLMIIIISCTLLAMAVAFWLPKEYESTTLLRAKSQKSGGVSLQAASALAILGGSGGASPIQGYMELMKSRNVLDPIIEGLDLPDEKKAKLDAKGFAKSNLKIMNAKGTDLLELTAVGRSPEEAQKITKDVVSNFQQLLTKMNQSEQSLMVKFLNDRIIVAKKEMEQAETNLEKFRQTEKIFVPDAQAKSAMEKVLGYDKKITEQRVQNQSEQVKMKNIDEQLQKQNAAISKYNLADNGAIQQFRSNIITKQMALIELKQRYTDKHPSIILAETEINELNSKLKNEVNTAIIAGTTTLNATHAGLLAQKVATETSLMVGQSMVDALVSLQAGAEKDISKLSASSMAYIGLERQVAITREVYAVLVKNYEQTRIQEAMESMDITIVDEADLPKKPSAPKKIVVTAAGLVVGVVFSLIYVVIAYNSMNRKSSNFSR